VMMVRSSCSCISSFFGMQVICPGPAGRRFRRRACRVKVKRAFDSMCPGFFLPTGRLKPPASGSGLPVRFAGNRSNLNLNSNSPSVWFETGLPGWFVAVTARFEW
jgi:hypothetical protein